MQAPGHNATWIAQRQRTAHAICALPSCTFDSAGKMRQVNFGFFWYNDQKLSEVEYLTWFYCTILEMLLDNVEIGPDL